MNTDTIRTRLNRFLNLAGHNCLMCQTVEILLTIHRHQRVTIKKLADYQSMKLAKVEPVISALVKLGLVEYPENRPEDIVLTQLGRQGMEHAKR